MLSAKGGAQAGDGGERSSGASGRRNRCPAAQATNFDGGGAWVGIHGVGPVPANERERETLGGRKRAKRERGGRGPVGHELYGGSTRGGNRLAAGLLASGRRGGAGARSPALRARGTEAQAGSALTKARLDWVCGLTRGSDAGIEAPGSCEGSRLVRFF
ncbi:hypothetical protein ZWY2020_048013 [Hordeum vulgare]|nr:hypothetical protein ZWY2020_048013 [Hordeum vulgare]